MQNKLSLQQIIEKACAFDPNKRFSNVGELKDALLSLSGQVSEKEIVSSAAYVNLGRISYKEGKFKEAKKYFKKAVELGDVSCMPDLDQLILEEQKHKKIKSGLYVAGAILYFAFLGTGVWIINRDSIVPQSKPAVSYVQETPSAIQSSTPTPELTYTPAPAPEATMTPSIEITPAPSPAETSPSPVPSETMSLEEKINESREHCIRGNECVRAGDYSSAKQEFRKAIELNPDNANAHNGLGLVFYKLNLFDRALQEYENASALDSNNASAYNGMGNVYYSLKKLDIAETKYKKALSLNDSDAVVHANLGEVYFETDRTDSAYAEFKKALDLNPSHAGNERSKQRLSELEEKIAAQRAQKEEEKKEQELKNLMSSAETDVDAGRYSSAEKKLRSALNIKETSDTYYLLAKVQEKRNKLDSAKEYLEKALQLAPNNSEYSAAMEELTDALKKIEEEKRQYTPSDISDYLEQLVSEGKIVQWDRNADVFLNTVAVVYPPPAPFPLRMPPMQVPQTQRAGIGDYGFVRPDGRSAIIENRNETDNDLPDEEYKYSRFFPHGFVRYLPRTATVKEIRSQIDAAIQNAPARRERFGP